MKTIEKKLERILTSKYSKIGYIELLQEVLGNIQFVAHNTFRKESSSFADHINGSVHIGNYNAPQKKVVALFSVELKKESYVENSRSIQRNYAKKLLENGNCDAAIIAFYTEDEPKWRLSFVRLDYEMKIEHGKLKTTENLTPAKRYSFLVGENEPSHTAVDRFLRIVNIRATTPTIDDLEDAFSVEKVTDEFFELYCEKFHILHEQLDAIEDFVIEAKRHNFTSVQFAKKLLGQIVFLYFLQKKGWMGVEPWPKTISAKEYENAQYSKGSKSRELIPLVYNSVENGMYVASDKVLTTLSPGDKEVLAHSLKGKAWGTGPQDFVRSLFNKAIQDNQNFYNDVLAPLFYEALNSNRGPSGYYARLQCCIPFLAGGLFEPIEGYDWKHNKIIIPNEVFSNVATKGRDADGIIDIFDRYNFTMSEDEPMEREVAIDPEMLGKVFENLLEVKDRKTRGAFYTPREIVYYICQESLISYITRKTGLNENDVRDFICYSDFIVADDMNAEKRRLNSGYWISSNLFSADGNGHYDVENLKKIDLALETVKILDPAVGSGAFPLCMVNEIVRIRQNITEYLTLGMSEFEKKLAYLNERSAYWLKYHAIRSCIYAVDVEPSAVDIARLRLWLSLVIEADASMLSMSQVGVFSGQICLPNLDETIHCGDSILKKFYADNLNVHDEKVSKIVKRLMDEQMALFSCSEQNKKAEIKHNIQTCKEIIIGNFAGQHSMANYHDLSTGTPKAFIPWQLDFAAVYFENNGFDIVVGNPPYVQLQSSISQDDDEKVGDRYENSGYSVFSRTGDLYCLFYELGLSLLREGGCLAYITSNKWMRTKYGKPLRDLFTSRCNPKIIIDFSGTRVFDTAQVDVCILLLDKNTNQKSTKACTIEQLGDCSLDDYVRCHSVAVPFEGDNIWNIASLDDASVKAKIEATGKPISEWGLMIKYGIKTGLNEAYVVDDITKQHLCDEDPESEQLLRPVLKGRDIVKWGFDYKNLWIIVVHNGVEGRIPRVDIDSYKSIKQHLLTYYDKLSARADKGNTPYHLRDCAYLESFAEPKIIFQEMVQSPAFAYDANGQFMCLDTARIITGEHLEYLTGLFNSNLFFFAVKHFYSGGKLGGSGIRMKHTFFKDFSAYVPTTSEEEYIRELVISDASDKDKKINDFFYSKYGLTSEEIDYIERDITKKVE